MWEIESTGYMTSESRWHKLFGRNINRDIDRHQIIRFRDTKTHEIRRYKPYLTCCNQSKDVVFTCSNCKAIIIGDMIDDYDMTVSMVDGMSYCPNCGARVVRDATTLIHNEEN